MDKTMEDFDSLSKDIVLSQMQGLGTGKYALGRTKILMMPEIRQVLEKCMEKASEMRNRQAKVLKKVFTIYMGAKEFHRRKYFITQVQKRYKEKYQYKKNQWALQFQRIFDEAVIKYKSDRRLIQE